MFNLDPIAILLSLPGIIIGFAFHEFAHALVADRLGDPTPRLQGRLTLSPVPHIDIIGIIMFAVFRFGWARPVQVNTRYFKKPRRDDILVSVAGCVANFIVALIFAFIYKLFITSSFSATMSEQLYRNISLLISYTISMNVTLAAFNLLPIPPLDGFHILANIIPARNYKIIYTIERYSTIILIILIATPIVSYILTPIISLLIGVIRIIVGL